jgi:hypothetical protein
MNCCARALKPIGPCCFPAIPYASQSRVPPSMRDRKSRAISVGGGPDAPPSTPATRDLFGAAAPFIAAPSGAFSRRGLGGQICVLTVRGGPDAEFQRVGADGQKLLTAATVRIVGDRPRVGSREAFEKVRFRHLRGRCGLCGRLRPLGFWRNRLPARRIGPGPVS